MLNNRKRQLQLIEEYRTGNPVLITIYLEGVEGIVNSHFTDFIGRPSSPAQASAGLEFDDEAFIVTKEFITLEWKLVPKAFVE
mgnify:FL=1